MYSTSMNLEWGSQYYMYLPKPYQNILETDEDENKLMSVSGGLQIKGFRSVFSSTLTFFFTCTSIFLVNISIIVDRFPITLSS